MSQTGADWLDDDDAVIQAELEAMQRAAGGKGGKPHIDDLLSGEATERNGRPYLIGLALSGGGIRSATFSLGVMQRLAAAGILKHVDYLSTVSGGGYIGAALSWWL